MSPSRYLTDNFAPVTEEVTAYDLPVIGELPADLDAVILRCLAKDPADRFQTVGELEAALGACGVAAAWTDQSAEAWWQKHEPEAVRKAEALGLA